jgi:hypothetical protein
MIASYQSPGPCPCGEEACEVVGTKLTRPLEGDPTQHLVGCNCIRHRNGANSRRGRRAEVTSHRQLGGTGALIRDDLHHSYSLNVTVERKEGRQVPARFVKLIESTWVRHAMAQAIKKRPIGTDAFPALHLFPPGGGSYLVVDIGEKELRS